MRRYFLFALVVLVAIGAAAQDEPQQKKAPSTLIKVNIHAAEYDRRLLLEKLNEHGRDQGVRFEQADQDFSYRIEFTIEQGTKIVVNNGTGGTHNSSGASATVFDAKGAELFHFSRANRNTDGGATNATAKEIIKRLLRLRP